MISRSGIRVMTRHGLALLVAGLSCLSYSSGQETKAAVSESLEALRERAEQGDAGAQASLAYLYYRGQGVPQDHAEAFRWYLKAAEKGDATAQFNVGLLYYNGRGTKQDNAWGIIWFRKAAEQGLPRAQAMAAGDYESSGDYAKALDLYRKAAESGNDFAQYRLGTIYTYGPYTPWNKIAPTDLTLGVKWLRRAVESDNPDAEEALGSLYEQGRGVIQDFKESVRLYRMAAEQGHSDAQYELGMMYLSGKGVAENPILAHMWFNIAAAQTDRVRVFPVESAIKGRELAEAMMKVLMISDGIEQAQEFARNWKPRTRVDSGPSRPAQVHVLESLRPYGPNEF